MAVKRVNEMSLEECRKVWFGLLDAVFDLLIDGEADDFKVPFYFLCYGRDPEDHGNQENMNRVAIWHDSDAEIVTFRSGRDPKPELSQLKNALKKIAVFDDPSETKDVYVNFNCNLKYDMYHQIVDALAGIAFSLFFAESIFVRMYDDNDIMPVCGKVYIGVPSEYQYNKALDAFMTADLIDRYINVLFEQSRLRSPTLLMASELGNMFTLNATASVQTAYLFHDSPDHEELLVQDTLVNYGFDNYFKVGVARLQLLLEKISFTFNQSTPDYFLTNIDREMAFSYLKDGKNKALTVLDAFSEFARRLGGSKINALQERPDQEMGVLKAMIKKQQEAE